MLQDKMKHESLSCKQFKYPSIYMSRLVTGKHPRSCRRYQDLPQKAPLMTYEYLWLMTILLCSGKVFTAPRHSCCGLFLTTVELPSYTRLQLLDGCISPFWIAWYRMLLFVLAQWNLQCRLYVACFSTWICLSLELVAEILPGYVMCYLDFAKWSWKSRWIMCHFSWCL